jgi:hypothetical protein
MKTSLHIQRLQSWMAPRLATMGSTWVKWVNPGVRANPFPAGC